MSILSNNEEVFTDEENVSTESASFSKKLSSIKFDEEKKDFWASIDHVCFETPYQVIHKILKAQGYAMNLENTLAALDSFRIAIKATGQQKNPDTPFQAKSFTYGIHFKMPNKNSKGDLLDTFYQEINAYESELARLQQFERDSENEENDNDVKNEEKLQSENRKLRQMNDRLAAKVDELTRQVIVARKIQAESNQALKEAEKLPVDMKVGSVRDISFVDRSISIKTESQSYNISMLDIDADTLPAINDPVIFKISDGRVKNIFFYASQKSKSSREIGQVLHRENSSMKIQMADRHEFIVRAKNEVEKKILDHLSSGDKLLVFRHGNQIIKYEKIESPDNTRFEDGVNEQIVRHQIGEIEYEKFIGDNLNQSDTNEEEAA